MKMNNRFKILFVLLLAVVIIVSLVFVSRSCWHKKLSYKDVCSEHADKKDVNIILFYYFSKNSCSDCLRPVFNILKKLPSYFYCYGVMPDGNGIYTPIYFNKIGLKIEILEMIKLDDDSPLMYPTLAGYKKNGDLIFILPLSYIGPQIMEEYLYSLYYNNVGLERKLN